VTAPLGAGLSYSIDGTNYTNTSGIFTGVTPGTYNVTVKNAAGCISTATVATINGAPTAPAAPTVTTADPATCSDVTGTITVTHRHQRQASATASMELIIQTQRDLHRCTPGTYNVTVKNAAGCISSATTANDQWSTCRTSNTDSNNSRSNDLCCSKKKKTKQKIKQKTHKRGP
jgi:hypothetical protein